jgi:hypothetical protein
VTNLTHDEFQILEAIQSAAESHVDPGVAVANATPLMSTRSRNELLDLMHKSGYIDGIFQRNAADDLYIAAPTRLKPKGLSALSEGIRTRSGLQADLVERLAAQGEPALETFFASQSLGEAFNKPLKGWGKQKRINEALALAKSQGRLDAVLEDASARFFEKQPKAGVVRLSVPAENQSAVGIDHDYVFVLMPFGEVWSAAVYEMLQGVAKHTSNARAIRMERADDIAKPGHITLQIEDAIRKSGAIIADITSVVLDDGGRPYPNPNVMWELGYAHACAKNIVIINQNPDQSPFDMLDLRQVKYSVPCSEYEIDSIVRHLDEALNMGG